MGTVYYHKFVAVQSDGDIFDPESPRDKQPTMSSLGKAGWHVVGIMSGSAHDGFSHTLILEQRCETRLDDVWGDIREGEPT